MNARSIGISVCMVTIALTTAAAAQEPEDPQRTIWRTTYAEDPAAFAQRLREDCARAPHDVDLIRAAADFLCNEVADAEHGSWFADALLERAPDDPSSYPPAFFVYMHLGNQERLEEVADAAVVRFPTEPMILFNHGLAHQRSMHSTVALASLKKASELDPENVLYHFAVADVHEQMRDFEAAEPRYRRCLELEPMHPGAQAGLAQVLGFLGRDEEAERVFRRAMAREVREAGYPYALFLIQRGRHEEALPFLRMCVEVYPNHRMGWNNLARCLKKLGKDRQATRALERFRELQRQQDLEERERLENILRAREHARTQRDEVEGEGGAPPKH